MSTDPQEILKQLRLDEVVAFRRTLSDESDRGCALMAGAYLDSELEKLLRLYLVDDPGVAGEIFGQSRPLGTFSSRIDLAFLLGLIDATTRRDMHLIRKIRNDFGHDFSPLGFDTQRIADRCRELTLHNLAGASRTRFLFTNTVLGVLASVHTALLNRPRLVERPRTHVTQPIDVTRFDQEIEEAIAVVGNDREAIVKRVIGKLLGNDPNKKAAG